MDQRIIDLYDNFTHDRIDRRTFMERLTVLAGSTAAATALLPILSNDYAKAAIVAPDDPRLVIERITYPAPDGGAMKGYMARPAQGAGKRPAVIVVHENRGLNPHIEDVTRRLGLEGFVAFAPDLLSLDGGTPADEDKAREIHGKLDAQKTVARLAAAVPFLAQYPASTGAVGAIGFCWGGGMVNQLAAASDRLKAAVAYYGRQLPADKVPSIKAALMLHYGGLDQGINAGIPAFEEALKKTGTTYELFVYDGANHAFNNDTAGPRYNKEAADLAWNRTVAFLKKHLGETRPA
jgi:carboxymethylenebutenolidase